MIIFDTSVLFGLTRQNPTFDLLRALKQSGTHRIGIPWMVHEELVAQQVWEYKTAYTRAAAAINDLNRKSPWGAAAPMKLPENCVTQAQQYWRDQYTEVLEILETSGESAKMALLREANREKPAKVEKKEKGGARDVAIWLSVIDYLKSNPDEEVFFVCNNTDDFGNGAEYPSPMAEDLGDMYRRLTQLSSMEEFVGKFTKPISADLERVRGLLDSLISTSPAPVQSAAQNMLNGEWFEGTQIQGVVYEPFRWQSWLLPPSVVVRNVSDASGHKIGDEEWYTAEVHWILLGFAQPAGPPQGLSRDIGIVHTACQWPTKVLFSTREGQIPAIVESRAPTALDPSKRAELQPLLEQAIASPSEAAISVGITGRVPGVGRRKPIVYACPICGRRVWAVRVPQCPADRERMLPA